MYIQDDTKIPKIEKFGYFLKCGGYRGDGGTNYFLEPELLERVLCETIEESIKSIDKLIKNNERFL